MDDYPCTLVRLKGVYFTSPIGTLYNVGSWKSKACSYGLTRIVDSAGHIANIRTLGSFTQKFNKGLTANEYDITGIVLPDKGEWLHIDGDKSNLKQMDGYVFSHSLRIRSVDDLKDKGTAGHKVPIVYWLGINTTNSSYWVPAYGEGEFNLIKGITGATGPNNSARVSYILKDIPGAAEDANCYQGYSTVTYFDATYGGYFYELSTSTKTRSGQILFSFTVGVWGSAGRYMKLQSSTDGASWTDVPGADIELWNSYSSGTAAASDYTRLYSNQSFAFIIPDGAGKDRLYVRLTTQGKQNKRSDGSSSAVSNASSFALYYFAFSELKRDIRLLFSCYWRRPCPPPRGKQSGSRITPHAGPGTIGPLPCVRPCRKQIRFWFRRNVSIVGDAHPFGKKHHWRQTEDRIQSIVFQPVPSRRIHWEGNPPDGRPAGFFLGDPGGGRLPVCRRGSASAPFTTELHGSGRLWGLDPWTDRRPKKDLFLRGVPDGVLRGGPYLEDHDPDCVPLLSKRLFSRDFPGGIRDPVRFHRPESATCPECLPVGI